MLAEADRAVLLFLNHLGPEGPAREAVVRCIATGFYWVPVAVILYLTFRKPDGKRVFIACLGGFALAFIVGKAINFLAPRDRPYIVLPDEVRHIKLIIRTASFPSIHAVSTFGMTGGVLFGRYWRHGLVMLAFGLPMIAARVAAGVHWPTDVLGGAAIGLLAAGAWAKLGHKWCGTTGEPAAETADGNGSRALGSAPTNGNDNASQ